MIKTFKKLFYFPFAYYFRFFAKIRLTRWKPYIIVVTGSSGKTILLNLLESQIREGAKYSHFANSSYGIPFDILGLKRTTLMHWEWIYLIIAAPFSIFKKNPQEHIYIAEADCDRPYEGKFLASLLKPEITLWISSGRTHTANFDYLVKNGAFKRVEEAIAYEFGYFLEYSKKYAIINSDSGLIKSQTERTKVKIIGATINDLKGYEVSKTYTQFKTENEIYKINGFFPKWNFYSIEMTMALLKLLKIKPDNSFSKFNLPPGRGTILKGTKKTTIIDSTYNATPDAVKAVLEAFNLYPSKDKWVVLGDMIELGVEERQEHQRLADILSKMDFKKLILVGPRLSKYTYPKLASQKTTFEIINFILPGDALDYIKKNINGKEVLLCKGARFLEGVIEHLLLNKDDIKKLPRRERAWEARRRKFGL